MTAVSRLAAGLLMTCLAAPSVMAGPIDPSERFDSLIKINSARDVDWYTPLEIAPGRPAVPLPSADPGQRSIVQDALDKATDYVAARGTAAFLVWQGGKLQWAYYGPGVGPATRIETASMHKSVLALLFGAALREGLIHSIDEPAATYLPEWADDSRATITLRDLLTMASGLENGSGDYGKTSPEVQLMVSNDIAQAALSRPAVGPAHVEFDYNNTDSEILGIILQRATGMRYAAYLSKTLLAPIGAGDGRVWLDRPDGMAHTFCCLQLTGEDWLRIGLLLKDLGRADGREVIPAAWIEAMMAPSANNPNYGLQLWRASPHVAERRYNSRWKLTIPARQPFLAPDMVFFDGWAAQRVYVSRAADLVIVRIGDVSLDWDDSFVPNLILRGIKTSMAR